MIVILPISNTIVPSECHVTPFMISQHWFRSCLDDVRQHYFTHWGHATHICVNKQTIICSDNALSAASHYLGPMLEYCWLDPRKRNYSKILIEVYSFSFRKMAAIFLGLNILSRCWTRSLSQYEVAMPQFGMSTRVYAALWISWTAL